MVDELSIFMEAIFLIFMIKNIIANLNIFLPSKYKSCVPCRISLLDRLQSCFFFMGTHDFISQFVSETVIT